LAKQSYSLFPWLVYLSVATLLAYPFLAYEYLFAADQYVHGYNACVLEEMRANSGSFYHQWFQMNTFPEPNWVGHGILWVLAKAVPLYVAEKVFVILLILGNGYAFLSAKSALVLQVDAESKQSAWPWKTAAALLSLIFLFGAIWQLGFVNYLIGMVGVIVGLTHTSRMRSMRSFAVIAWGLFTYFCHPIAFLFFMGTFSLRELLRRDLLSKYLYPLRGDWASFFKSFALWFGLPLLLLVAYIATHSEISTFRGASPWRLLGLVYYHNDLALFALEEIPYAKIAMFATIAMTLWGVFLLWKDQRSFTLAAVGAGVLLGAIVFSPDYFAGGALIHQRLLPFLFVWALWCSAHAFSLHSIKRVLFTRRLGYGLVLLAVLATSGLNYQRTEALPAIVDLLDEFREFANEIPKGTAVLPVSATATGVVKGQELSLKPVLHHYAGNLDCRRNVVLLDNYEAYVGYFPLLWKDGKNPFLALSTGLERHPAFIEISGAEWLGNNVDYIMSMGQPVEAFEEGTAQWLFSNLRTGNQPDYETLTSRRGNFHLIKVNKETLGRASF
jgi:hypothetical protein